MSVTIRLAQFGKIHAPTFRIVAAPTKSKRDSSFLEILGSFNPGLKKDGLIFDKAKFDSWVKKGAMVSPAVNEVVSGKFTFTRYSHKTAAAAKAAKAEENKKAAEEVKVEDKQ
jgi:small subunit ribosomal protein S16